MKVDSANSTENNLNIKQEKTYKTDNSSMFSDLLLGALGYENFGFSTGSDDFGMSGDIISSIVDETDISKLKASYKYDCMSIDRDDAMFFANAVKGENYQFTVNGQVLMQNMATNAQEVGAVYKSAEVSKTLMNMIENSKNSHMPVRIDFGNDISAIIRVSQDGKISAEFIPSDKVAEEYLKNNISYLQQAFEEQDISYGYLTYRDEKQKNKQQQQQQAFHFNQQQDKKKENN